jgi:DNA-binding MarR family transcriptional regulator
MLAVTSLYPASILQERAVPSDDDLALADEVSGQLIRLLRLMDRRQTQYQAEHPDAVERATYFLLVHLVKGGPQRAGALAEAVHSDPSTISRQVAQLVRLGLVERTADPEDGRATLLAATAEGRRVFEENRRVRVERTAEMLEDWSAADRRKLAELLGRFTTAFENAPTRRAEAAAGARRPAS